LSSEDIPFDIAAPSVCGSGWRFGRREILAGDAGKMATIFGEDTRRPRVLTETLRSGASALHPE